MKELGDDDDGMREWLAEETGVLFWVKWFRVVLDEAHAIKNHDTHGESAKSAILETALTCLSSCIFLLPAASEISLGCVRNSHDQPRAW